MPYVAGSDGTQLFFSDWGDAGAPPVVFAHAWGLNAEMWRAQVPALLDAGFRCIAYDRRGHCRSDQPGHGYDLDSLAGDLAAVIGRLDLDGAVLAGHSMGAAEVVHYLARYGTGRAAGAFLSAPTTPALLRGEDNPDGMDEQAFGAARAAMRVDLGAFLTPSAARDYFAGSQEPSPALADWTLRQLMDTPLPVMLETHRTYTRADLRGELAGLRLPVLVLHGTADQSVPLALGGEPTAALIPGARLVALEGAGHGLYASEAARYNSELISFARRCLPAVTAQPSPGGNGLQPGGPAMAP
jgi:non-heme chloroperoxidase